MSHEQKEAIRIADRIQHQSKYEHDAAMKEIAIAKQLIADDKARITQVLEDTFEACWRSKLLQRIAHYELH